MKFVMHEPYNIALCGHFGEIQKDWYIGTDDEQDTKSENESDCEWSDKIFITKLLKNKKLDNFCI